MKRLVIPMPIGTSLPLANGLRQIAMSEVPCWRPVAFSLNREFNKMYASGGIIEKPFRIGSNLASCTFTPKGELTGNILVETVSFTRELEPSKVSQENFNVLGKGYPLVTSSEDTPVEFTVVYRYGAGAFDSSQNEKFLIEKGLSPKDYQTIASRHTTIAVMTYDIEEVSESEERLSISIESDAGDESEVLVQASILYQESMSKAFDLLRSEAKTL